MTQTSSITTSGVAYLRTPDDRFEDLDGYPYSPNYLEVDGFRMHYLDEGGSASPIVLCLHGEPTWSYLYRDMIPTLVERGMRVIAPDLIGFGRSDKPVDRNAYSYDGMVAWLAEFVTSLGLDDITLFCQDWGGLLGLRVVADDPARFDRVCAANTALPYIRDVGVFSGFEENPDADPATAMINGFLGWLEFSQSSPDFPIGEVIQAATAVELTPAEIDGYDAPFPDETYKAGARALPTLVASAPESNAAAWKRLEQWTKPFLTLWAPDDPVLGSGQAQFCERIPGAADQPHAQLRPASHFLQDDVGPELANRLADWMFST